MMKEKELQETIIRYEELRDYFLRAYLDYYLIFEVDNFAHNNVTINVYNEREDFMFKLFGISSVDVDAEDYWDDVETEYDG